MKAVDDGKRCEMSYKDMYDSKCKECEELTQTTVSNKIKAEGNYAELWQTIDRQKEEIDIRDRLIVKMVLKANA